MNLQHPFTNPSSSSPPLSSSSFSDSNTIQNDLSGKPLSELTIVEVGTLLESIEFDEYKAVFTKNKIDGKCLMKCNTVEDAVNMGITIFVKASLLLDEIRKCKATGVPMEYLVDQSNAEEVKSPLVSNLYVVISIAYMLIVQY